ncbi:MAG: hypothetical protein WCL44_01140 [bacterium]
MRRTMMSILLALAAFSAGGCLTSTKCRVTVSNASERDIRSVVLVDTNGFSYTFTNIKAHSAAEYRSLNGMMGRGLVMSIADETGTNVSRTVDLDPPVEPKYGGRLQFQIEENARVRTFFQPSEDGGGGSMPWAVAPPWQGTITMPGMTPQQQY